MRNGNRPLSHTFPDGKTTHWSYTARNLVNTVHYENKIVLTNTHDAAYRLTNEVLGNGLSRTINYGRQDNLRTTDSTWDGVTSIDDLSLSYTYAADKQITAENVATGGVVPNSSFSASYDDGNRLTNWNRAAYPVGSGAIARQSQSWSFDDAGNWTSTVLDGTTQNRTHSDSDQITNLAGNATTSDAKGNLLTFEHNNIDYSIEYDVENRMVKVEVDNQDVEYRYDAYGRRIIRKEGSTKTALLWWGSSECAEVEHAAGQATIQNDIFSDPNQLNAVIARAKDGSKFDIEWYHKNYLDHVYAVSDDSGDILEHYRYTAYGEQEIYNSTGTKIAISAIGNEITWNTRRIDPLSGFYMYKYRQYAPQLGRWPSRDPIEEIGGVNLYAFVGSDSLNYWDELGLIQRPGTEEEEDGCGDSGGYVFVSTSEMKCKCGKKTLVDSKGCKDGKIVPIDKVKRIGITVGHGNQLTAQEQTKGSKLANFINRLTYDRMACVSCWQQHMNAVVIPEPMRYPRRSLSGEPFNRRTGVLVGILEGHAELLEEIEAAKIEAQMLCQGDVSVKTVKIIIIPHDKMGEQIIVLYNNLLNKREGAKDASVVVDCERKTCEQRGGKIVVE